MLLGARIQMPANATIGRFVAGLRRASAIALRTQPLSPCAEQVSDAAVIGVLDAQLMPARQTLAGAASGTDTDEGSAIHMPEPRARTCLHWQLEQGLFGFTAHGWQEARAAGPAHAFQTRSTHRAAFHHGCVLGSRRPQRHGVEAADSAVDRCSSPGWSTPAPPPPHFSSSPSSGGRASVAQQHVRRAHQTAGPPPRQQPSEAASTSDGDTLDWDGDGGAGRRMPQPKAASRMSAQEQQQQQQGPGPVRPGLLGRAPSAGGQRTPGLPGGQRQLQGPGPPRPPQARLRAWSPSPGALITWGWDIKPGDRHSMNAQLT